MLWSRRRRRRRRRRKVYSKLTQEDAAKGETSFDPYYLQATKNTFANAS